MRKYFPALFLLIAMPAFAHPGHGLSTLSDGLLHPLTGLDHLLMLSAIGILSANIRYPLRFIGCSLLAMFAGALIGHLYGTFGGIEPLINFSVFAVGGLILCAVRGKIIYLVPLLLSVHGWAHGVEGSDGALFYIFTIGFLIASCVILIISHYLGLLVYRNIMLRKVVGTSWIAAITLSILNS